MPGLPLGIGLALGLAQGAVGGAVAPGGGAAPALEQAKSATSLLATTATNWDVAPTAGNLLVLAVTSAGTFTTPTGWTLDGDATAVNNLAWYVFYRTADGTSLDTPSYTQAGTYSSVWSLAEFSGTTGFEEASAQQTAATGQFSTSTPAITPAAGSYLLVALLSAGSSAIDQLMQDALDLSDDYSLATHAGFDGTLAAGAGHENIGQTLAYKAATLDGSTAESATGTVPVSEGATQFNNEGGIILAFAASSGGGGGGGGGGTVDPTTLDATNTGAVLGGTLTASGDIGTSANGQLIENLEITGRVTIFHDNVTVRNCIIHGDQYYGVIIDGSVADTTTGLTVEYCTFDDGGTGFQTNAIAGSGTFHRNNISKCENGILLYEASTITENYIHDFNNDTGVAHYDGIENNGVSNVTIRSNRIINQQNETSAIMLNNEFGHLANILIDGNYLEGGGYTIYCDNTKSAQTVDAATITITNNTVVAGAFGTGSFYTSGVTFGAGNTFP